MRLRDGRSGRRSGEEGRWKATFRPPDRSGAWVAREKIIDNSWEYRVMGDNQPDETPTTQSSGRPEPLLRALAEIEDHVRAQGWDQPPRLYSLAPTRDVVARQPALAEQLGVDAEAPPVHALTPIEQELDDRPLDDILTTISWPGTVSGCALVVERIVLPPHVEEQMPDDAETAASWAQRHPSRSDVRIVIGVLRDGSRSAVVRVKGHDAPDELIRNDNMSPDISDALAATFTE